MTAFLKDHPLAVESFFETSLVLTYAVPRASLAPLIPECLSLDTFEDQWAFLAVAVVKTKALRPRGFPQFLGNDFILTGYRIFVKYVASTGKRLRGLYIIRSETDKARMVFLGNLFTHYNYRQTDLRFHHEADVTRVESVRSKLKLAVRRGREDISLPAESPFKDWKEARRFAGPLPFTFTYNTATQEVLIIEGVRKTWTPEPVEVLQHQTGFIDSLHLNQVTLASAFMIKDIPYYWKKGRKDPWKQA